jgi:hypothetical protein
MTQTQARLAEILATPVFIDGMNRPFGALTVDAINARDSGLQSATGGGPTARVAPVARAWGELSLALAQAGVSTVGELDGDVVLALAPSLWIVPPGGQLLA